MKTKMSLWGLAFSVAGAAFGAAPVLTVGFEDAVNCDFDAALSWTADDGAVTIERKIGETGAWKTKATLDAGTTSWVDPSPVLGKTYFYRVTVAEESSEAVRFNRVRKISASLGTVVTQCTSYWGNTRTSESVFDGRIDNGETGFCDGHETVTGTNKPKIGVDFGAANVTVALARFYPRIQANAAGQSSGSVLFGSLNDGASEMATDDPATVLTSATQFSNGDAFWQVRLVAEPAAYRTYYYQGSTGGQMTELEFYGWTQADVEAAAETTLTLTVARSDYTDSFAVLAWDADVAAGAVTVQRRKGESGAWTDLATSDDGVYTDETMAYGRTWFYRITDGVTTSEPVRFQRLRRLSTDGYGKFWQGTAPESWGNHPGYQAFDGVIEWSWPDLDYAGNPKVGVDFGEATNYIALVRLYPRHNAYCERMSNLVVYGSDATPQEECASNELGTPVTESAGTVSEYKWYEVPGFGLQAYRLYYFAVPNGNVAECQFYGWTKDDLPKPKGVVVIWK